LESLFQKFNLLEKMKSLKMKSSQQKSLLKISPQLEVSKKLIRMSLMFTSRRKVVKTRKRTSR